MNNKKNPCDNHFCGADMPTFCPPPMPKPIPNNPPVPSVVEGESLYEYCNDLGKRVNVCIDTWNSAMNHAYRLLENMHKAAQENGSFYGCGEVYSEQGYDADSGATYTLIHKAACDRHGEPIKIGLHLAYNNTTNSKIEQDMFSASKVLYADKLIVAQPKTENGWYGTAIYRGAPIPAFNDETLYTVGFTRNGVMRVYHNTVNADQLLNDTIENAMGVSGVLIQNGQITDDAYISTIPMYDRQTSRVCMGQNLTTKEVIILSCGYENNVNKKGLTSAKCAEILRNYGCDIAVELCESDSAAVMDKGSFTFTPADNTVPTAYAYWYISRKCFFRNDFQSELAETTIILHENMWQGYLTNLALDAETKARIQADAELQSNIDAEEAARIAADELLQNNIDTEAQERADEDASIRAELAEEVERAKAAEAAEKERAEAAEQALDNKKVNRNGDTMTGSLSITNGNVNVNNGYIYVPQGKVKVGTERTLEIGDTGTLINKTGIEQRTGSMNIVVPPNATVKVQTPSGGAVRVTNIKDGTASSDAITKSQYDAEVNRAQTAEATETTRAKAAEQALGERIDAEELARANGDATLHQEILSEQNARADADSELQRNINTEATNRSTADTELQANIDAETTARENADNELLAKISENEAESVNRDNATNDRVDAIINGATEMPYLNKNTGGEVGGAIQITNGDNGDLILNGDGDTNQTPEVTSTGTSLTLTVHDGDVIVKNDSEVDGKGMVTNLREPNAETDAVNKKYADATYVPKEGSTEIHGEIKIIQTDSDNETVEISYGSVNADGIGAKYSIGVGAEDGISIIASPSNGYPEFSKYFSNPQNIAGFSIKPVGEEQFNRTAVIEFVHSEVLDDGALKNVQFPAKNIIRGIDAPEQALDVANKQYVDSNYFFETRDTVDDTDNPVTLLSSVFYNGILIIPEEGILTQTMIEKITAWIENRFGLSNVLNLKYESLANPTQGGILTTNTPIGSYFIVPNWTEFN